MARHALVFPNASWRRSIADSADAPVRFRAVSRALPVEVVLFYHPLKAFAFRSADNIDIITCLKLGDAQIDLTLRRIIIQPKLTDKSLRLATGLFEFAQKLLGHTRFLLCTEAHLHG